MDEWTSERNQSNSDLFKYTVEDRGLVCHTL